jgi:hypothetical protein
MIVRPLHRPCWRWSLDQAFEWEGKRARCKRFLLVIEMSMEMEEVGGYLSFTLSQELIEKLNRG